MRWLLWFCLTKAQKMRIYRWACCAFKEQALREAEREIALERQAVHQEFQKLRLHTEKEALKQGLAQAEEEAARLYQTQSDIGRREGRQAAYYACGRKLGLTDELLRSNEPTDDNVPQLDLDGVYANIYLVTGKHWIVRLIHNGELQYRRFPINPTRTRGGATEIQIDRKAVALFEAATYRNAFCTMLSSQRAAIFDECRELVEQRMVGVPASTEAASLRNVAIQVCEEFHRRLLTLGVQAEHALHVGQDPEARFQIANTAILNQPWLTLYARRPPPRIIQAFASIGLDERRTIRDLLMVTPNEFDDVIGFGPKSREALRTALGSLGLALWGEDPPRAVIPRTDTNIPGQREFRAIDLSGTLDDDE